jgi:hypothetical protein
MPRGSVFAAAVVAVLVSGLVFGTGPLEAQESSGTSASPDRAILDRVAVRFYAPETGGASRPRFITERVLSFEARLLAMSEQGFAAATPPEERHLRQAIERHVAEELLSSLGIEGGKQTADFSRLADDARAELEERIGGEKLLREAALAERIDPEEVQAIFLRHARAEYYLDHNVTPLLYPDDEQLHEVFRTAAHPFRNRHFEDVRKELARWLVAERLKAAESTFLQTARTRVKIVIVGH